MNKLQYDKQSKLFLSYGKSVYSVNLYFKATYLKWPLIFWRVDGTRRLCCIAVCASSVNTSTIYKSQRLDFLIYSYGQVDESRRIIIDYCAYYSRGSDNQLLEKVVFAVSKLVAVIFNRALLFSLFTFLKTWTVGDHFALLNT